MAYRSDVEAMEARLADLDAQVGDVTRERDELARIIADAHARERRAEILADLQAGGPTKRLYRSAAITVGAIAAITIGVFAYRAMGTSRVEESIAHFEELADKMCACRDRACADAVNDEITRWSSSIAKDTDLKPSESEMKRLEIVGKKFGECTTKAMSLESN